MAGNRKAFETFVLDFMGKLTQGQGNRTIYERLFKAMNDEQMEEFVVKLEEGMPLCIWASNFDKKEQLNYDGMVKLAKQYGLSLEQPLVVTDIDTGVTTVTPITYLVGSAEIRKQRQMLVKKMSAAKDDTMTDDLTGQVMGDSRAAGMSIPEAQVLRYLGLPKVCNELYNVKGGDNGALKAFRNDIITTGHTTTNGSLRQGSAVKALKTAYHLLRGRMIDNNLDKR